MLKQAEEAFNKANGIVSPSLHAAKCLACIWYIFLPRKLAENVSFGVPFAARYAVGPCIWEKQQPVSQKRQCLRSGVQAERL